MKYVVLIHSHPRPWGHPTADYVAEHQALPAEQRDELNEAFETAFAQLQASGELIGGEALGDPSTARLYRWSGGQPSATDGPYAESKEHLAGFFVIDVEGRDRAEEICMTFAGPGETVELRPAWAGEDEQSG
ncbi:MAG: YciI family protein [Nocardioidaceae bacterium]